MKALCTGRDGITLSPGYQSWDSGSSNSCFICSSVLRVDTELTQDAANAAAGHCFDGVVLLIDSSDGRTVSNRVVDVYASVQDRDLGGVSAGLKASWPASGRLLVHWAKPKSDRRVRPPRVRSNLHCSVGEELPASECWLKRRYSSPHRGNGRSRY